MLTTRPRRPKTAPLAHIHEWLRSLTEHECRDWSDEELRHIVRGYAFALDAAGVPFERQRAELGRMLKVTGRLDPKEKEALVVHSNIDGYRLLPPDAPAQTIYTQIRLRADEPHFLGSAAAHEGMHWLKGPSETNPIETSISYRLAFPIRTAGVSKKTRQTLETKTRAARVPPNKEHVKVIHAAQISAAVADSLRARLGDATARAFLQKVRAGIGPFDAYQALEKNAPRRRLPIE